MEGADIFVNILQDTIPGSIVYFCVDADHVLLNEISPMGCSI